MCVCVCVCVCMHERVYTHAKHLWCNKDVAKLSRIIPGSEFMNRLVTKRSDIRIQPRNIAY